MTSNINYRRKISDISTSSAALVIGNGPSAKMLDYESQWIRKITTIGMNSAFRYWDQVGFRPTFYACMDDVVIKNIADDIYRLVNENEIKFFFLKDAIKEIYPNLADNHRIIWHSDVVNEEPLFQNSPVSTGGWAIRWMILLGCKAIGTIGIDGVTTEILAEASKDLELGPLGLRVDKTPDFNPNYFFSGYQQKGDTYQIPNNPAYERNKGRPFHEDALFSVDRYVKEYCIDVEIYDLSPLSTHAIFKKLELSDFRSATNVLVIIKQLESDIYDVYNKNAAFKNATLLPYVNKILIESRHNSDNTKLTFKDTNAFSFIEVDCFETTPIGEILSDERPSMVAILDADHPDGSLLIENAVISQLKGLRKFHFLDDSHKLLKKLEKHSEKLFWSGVSFFYENINFQYSNLYISEFLDVSMPAHVRCSGISVERVRCKNDIQFYPIISHANFSFTGKRFFNLADTIRDSALSTNRHGKSLAANLEKADYLDINSSWIGRDSFTDIWHSLADVICYVSDSQLGAHPNWKAVKLDITHLLAGNLDEEQIFSLIIQGSFIEWEVSGLNEKIPFKDILCKSQLSKELRYLLNSYPLQSFANVSVADPSARMILADTLIFLRSLLNEGKVNNLRQFSNRKGIPSYIGSFLGDTKVPFFEKIRIYNGERNDSLSLKFRLGPLKIHIIDAVIEINSDTAGLMKVRLCRDVGGQFEFSDKKFNLKQGKNEISVSLTMEHEHAGFRFELSSSDTHELSIQIKSINIVLRTNEYVSCEWRSTDYLVDPLSILSVTSSHKKILKAFAHEKYSQLLKERALPQGKVNILDPDALDERGHYIAYDRKLSQALHTKKVEVNVLCRRDIDNSLLKKEKNYYPTFTRHSWTIATSRDIFYDELKLKILDGTIELGDIVYFYTGSVYHVEVFFKISREHPSIKFHCNLFWEMIKDIASSQYKEDVRRIFSENLDIIDRVVITAPTEGVRIYIDAITSIKLPLAPHPCTGVPDNEFDGDYRSKSSSSQREKRIVFPGADTKCKGYELGIAAATKLSSLGYDCWVRRNKDGYADKNLHLIPEVMTDNDFKSFLAGADVIVLPYESEGFKYRTSGIVIDALYLSVPVVVMENTWLAEIAMKYSTGYICSENIDDISSSVIKLCDNYQTAISQLQQSKAQYHKNNSWAALSDSIINSDHDNLPLFKIANALYRHGHRNFAKTIYAGLYDLDGMSIYRFNRALCDS